MKSGRPAPGAVVLASLVGAASVLVGCETTVDPGVTTRSPGALASTTVFVAAGSTEGLLDQVVAEATGLSEAIVENEGQRDIVGRIETLWEAARPGIDEAAPDMLLEFDRAIALMRSAVERRRPADADKALNNLRNLIAAQPR